MIASRRKLRSILTGLGLSIVFAVVTIIPIGYFLVAYAQVQQEMLFTARIKANRLAKYIYVHRELWQYETLRLGRVDRGARSDRDADTAARLRPRGNVRDGNRSRTVLAGYQRQRPDHRRGRDGRRDRSRHNAS